MWLLILRFALTLLLFILPLIMELPSRAAWGPQGCSPVGVAYAGAPAGYKQVCENGICRMVPITQTIYLNDWKYDSQGNGTIYRNGAVHGYWDKSKNEFRYWKNGAWTDPIVPLPWKPVEKANPNDPFGTKNNKTAAKHPCPDLCQCAQCKEDCQCSKGKPCRPNCPCQEVVGELPPIEATATVANQALIEHPGVISDRVSKEESLTVNGLPVSRSKFEAMLGAGEAGGEGAEKVPHDGRRNMVVAVGEECAKQAEADFKRDPELVLLLNNAIRFQPYEDETDPVIAKVHYKPGLYLMSPDGGELAYDRHYPGARLIADTVKSFGGVRKPDDKFDPDKGPAWGGAGLSSAPLGVPLIVWGIGGLIGFFLLTGRNK